MNQRGFTYVALLIVVAVMGTALAATGEVWFTAQRREKERELLFVGGEFRRAIARYAEQDPGGAGRYPRRLEELLQDPRVPGVRRHLRRLYADPITGQAEWGLLKGDSGEIYGVYSLSAERPLKTANFDRDDGRFEGRKTYSDWVFTPLRTMSGSPAHNAAAKVFGRAAPPRR